MHSRLSTLGLTLVLTIGSGGAMSASATPSGTDPGPTPITRPGGLAARQLHAAAGDCELSSVVCRPARSGSCTNATSTRTPPGPTTPIKVLVRTPGTSTVTIKSVPFGTYVENVLPNEWVPSWDGDALKAGAVAVKSYAWYWMSHFGGYLSGKPANCFDVTDDADFQVYRANSATTRTTQKIAQSWPVFARKGGQVFQTQYRSTLTGSTSETCGTGATGTTMSQWGSQNCNEASTGNKFSVILEAYYGSAVQLATTRQLRAQHDFRYLQASSRVTVDPSTFRWAIDDGYGAPASGNTYKTTGTLLGFGQRGDVPTVVTKGDGFARVGVYRPSTNTFYVGTPTGRVESKVGFGAAGDVPVPAHYNGLAQPTQLAVFRPSSGAWYLAAPNGQVASKTLYGVRGDIPVPADYTGDGRADLAVFRPANGTWYVRGRASVHYGTKGDIPAPADYTGDGRADIAVYRPSNHTFYVRSQTSLYYGTAGDVPVTGDFTGDGRADLAVYRPSNHVWYVHGGGATAFGASGVRPIGAAPYRD